MFTFNPQKTTPLRYAYTWTIPFLLWAICPTLLSGQTAISLGDDDLVGENETVELSATINIPGEPPPGSGLISSSEAFTLLWYKRTIDEADYPAEPFATSGVEIGETTATLSDSPIEESTYYKVVLSDQTGVACEDEVLKVAIRLSKLLFHDSHTIYYDPGVPPINTGPSDAPTPYVDPGILPNAFHWLRPTNPSLAVVSKPVCYTRNTAFKVSALVKMDGLETSTIDLAAIKLKATASATGFEATISPNADVLTPVSGGYLFAMTTASAVFPDVINVFDLQMAWEYSENGGTDWSNLATTENSVYATLNNPTLNNPGQYLFHTTLHIACQEAAGLSDAENAVEAIYAKLATREISALGQASESFLSYWGAGFATDAVSTQELLYDKDGKCGAWASFWIDLLHTHGVANVELVNVERILTNGISPLPSNASALVANAVTAFNALPNPDIPSGYDLINQSIIMVRNWNIEINKFYKEVDAYPEDYRPLISITENNAAQEGIQAQGVNDDSESDIDDPISMFTDHALVRIQFVEVVGGVETIIYKYYDPSYGTGPFTATNDTDAFADWENSGIAGFAAFINYDTPIVKAIWIEKVNSTDNIVDLQREFYAY